MTETIRALYAEDNASDADLTRTHFAVAAPDIDLHVVTSGAACLEQVATGRYDVLLLDNHLTDTDGVALLRELTLREVPLPVVMVTSVGDEDLVVRVLRLGAWDYVPKAGRYVEQLPDVLRTAALEHRRLRAYGGVAARRRRRVVYVEQAAADIDLTRRHFAEFAPHLDLEVVPSGAEAMARVQAGGVDLLLIDLRMRDTDALDVLRSLRRGRVHVPVVVITGQGDEAAAVASLKLGAYDYIVKRDNYLTQMPHAIENAIHRAELIDVNRRLERQLAEREQIEVEKARLLVEVESHRRRIDEIVSSVPGVVWEAWGRPDRGEQRMQFISRQVEQMLGYDAQVWLSTPSFWLQIVHADDRERAAREAAEAFSSGKGGVSEFRWLAHDGRVVWVEARSTVITDTSGRPIGMRGVTMDITASRQAEDERKHLETQLRLSQKLESVGRLAGGVAHDFNNLLTGINGYADLIRQELGPNHPLSEDIQVIRTAGERAATLTQQLLAFSRRQLLQPRVVDFNALLNATIKLLKRVLGEDVALTTNLAADLGKVRADAGQIDQVIMNLAVNARDAMPGGGTLMLQTQNVDLDEAYSQAHLLVPPGAYVLFSVSDTGVGIPPETLPHIFEPFFTTKEAGKGTGLGLSTVYGIVKQSGGWVWAYSEVDIGTTFKIYLPRVEEAVPVQEEPRRETARPRGDETVLVVEDDDIVRRLVSQVLKKSGYVVLEASGPEHALQIAEERAEPIPLMITDVVMPGMSGRQLATRLAPTRPQMRVLYISGYTDDSVVRHGLLDPSMNFLQKPFTPSALARKVREVLDRPAV